VPVLALVQAKNADANVIAPAEIARQIGLASWRLLWVFIGCCSWQILLQKSFCEVGLRVSDP
jgi:hypothetical protein